MDEEMLKLFFYWVNERHSIYQKKESGEPRPWTTDSILNKYKFTNVFRELDRTTVWMRTYLTNPHRNAPNSEILFNCCVFRMFGTMEFSEAIGWIRSWDPDKIKRTARHRLQNREKVFTGAYIITNQGLKEPKEQVVVDYFLTPVWEKREELAAAMVETNTLQNAHELLSKFVGWGGGGFMAYEVVTDLNHTQMLQDATDRFTWANAGPGAKRGLNRLHNRALEYSSKNQNWNAEMQALLAQSGKFLGDHIPRNDFDMRSIEHSLCEWDKYMRVKLGQGTPRSIYR